MAHSTGSTNLAPFRCSSFLLLSISSIVNLSPSITKNFRTTGMGAFGAFADAPPDMYSSFLIDSSTPPGLTLK